MYIPKHFAVTDQTPLWELMRQFHFGLLITSPDGVPFASSIPFTPLEATHKLTGHLAKANLQWQHLEAAKEVLVVFQAEHAFISSRWYTTAPNVPTWNYATVHAYGTARLLGDAELTQQLEALMTQHGHEGEMQAYTPEYLAGMQRGIVGFELSITRLEGKFKLSQNKTLPDQQNVIAQLEQQGESERGIAARMQNHNQ